MPTADRRLIDAVRSRLRWWRLTNLCTRFVGHWLVNVEEGVARCRICRSVLFCGHASDDALWRHLTGHTTTCARWDGRSPCNCVARQRFANASTNLPERWEL